LTLVIEGISKRKDEINKKARKREMDWAGIIEGIAALMVVCKMLLGLVTKWKAQRADKPKTIGVLIFCIILHVLLFIGLVVYLVSWVSVEKGVVTRMGVYSCGMAMVLLSLNIQNMGVIKEMSVWLWDELTKEK